MTQDFHTIVAEARSRGIQWVINDLRLSASRIRSRMIGDNVRLDSLQSWASMEVAAEALEERDTDSRISPEERARLRSLERETQRRGSHAPHVSFYGEIPISVTDRFGKVRLIQFRPEDREFFDAMGIPNDCHPPMDYDLYLNDPRIGTR